MRRNNCFIVVQLPVTQRKTLLYPLGFLGALLLLPELPKPPLEPPVFDVGVVDGVKVRVGLSTVVDGVPGELPVGGAITLRTKLPNELPLLLRVGELPAGVLLLL